MKKQFEGKGDSRDKWRREQSKQRRRRGEKERWEKTTQNQEGGEMREGKKGLLSCPATIPSCGPCMVGLHGKQQGPERGGKERE